MIAPEQMLCPRDYQRFCVPGLPGPRDHLPGNAGTFRISGRSPPYTTPRSPEKILRLRLHGSGHSLVQMCCVPENAPENAPKTPGTTKVLCPRERARRSGNRRFHCRFLSTRCQSPLGRAKRCTVSLFFVDNGVHRGCENICSDRLNSTQDVRMYLSPD